MSRPSLQALVLSSLALGCARGPADAGPVSNDAAKTSAAAGARRAADDSITFTGMCDASGAVEVSAQVFAVADDEDNVIRTYDAERGGAPLAKFDLSPGLDLPSKGGAKEKLAPETDLEAATRIGDRAYWLTSHGRNSSGKSKPERLRFFATTLPEQGTPLTIVGKPYEQLLDDLLAEPRLSRFRLTEAAELAPKAPGGLNLEGMTAREGGGVWLGFRNPLPEGKALLLPFLNPEEVAAGEERASFSEPLTLDLGGLGVRSLSSWRGRYLIAAGHFDNGATSRLFTWDGQSAPSAVPGLDFAGFNPEGFFSPDSAARVLLLSDDGSLPIDGVPCKQLKDPAAKRFRGAWLRVASAQ